MEPIELSIQCQPNIAERLAAELSNVTGAPVDQAELDNLDGTPTTVLQVIQVAISVVAAVTPIVVAYITSKGVKKVKFGPIEIENPTREQWEHLWKDYVSGKSAGGAGDTT